MVTRWLKAGLGALLVIVGVALLVLPGPGLVFLAAGVALMLSQWPRGQRTLARLRLRLRERYGSTRVRRVEAHLPEEVCPPIETTELRALAEAPIEEHRTPEPS